MSKFSCEIDYNIDYHIQTVNEINGILKRNYFNLTFFTTIDIPIISR